MDESEVIPGFALVFRKDHRVYSVRGKNGNRIPLSIFGFRDGLSLHTAYYFGGTLAIMFILRHLPGLSLLVGWMPWLVAYPLLAGAAAFALSKGEPDGRKMLRWLATLLTHYVSPRERCAGRQIRGQGVTAVLSPVTSVAADERSGVLGPCRVRGPATIEFRNPVLVRDRRRHQRVARLGLGHEEAQHLVHVGDGDTLTVLP